MKKHLKLNQIINLQKALEAIGFRITAHDSVLQIIGFSSKKHAKPQEDFNEEEKYDDEKNDDSLALERLENLLQRGRCKSNFFINLRSKVFASQKSKSFCWNFLVF